MAIERYDTGNMPVRQVEQVLGNRHGDKYRFSRSERREFERRVREYAAATALDQLVRSLRLSAYYALNEAAAEMEIVKARQTSAALRAEDDPLVREAHEASLMRWKLKVQQILGVAE